LSKGILNTDSGPDFFNAKIKINDTVWAGNIEIHINASDWFKHNHHTDKAYDNVILHVVKNKDTDIFNSKNIKIPTVEISYPDFIQKNYENLKYSKHKIACENKLHEINKLHINSWLDSLLIKRLERKSNEINKLLKENNNNWEESFYILLFKHLGAKINAESFEMLARQTPLKILAKHKNSLLQTEALLFGQAGFLNDNINSKYYIELKREYKILKSKYKLSGIDKSLWKFLRLRPVNFPTIRIALASKLIYNSVGLFSKILETSDVSDIYKLLNIEVDNFWLNHYTFEKESVSRKKRLGKTAINTLIINTISPILFVYGSKRNKEELKTRAISFLEKIPAENNSIIRYWNNLNIKTENAYKTQAILELHNEYCLHKKCLSCKLGYQILLKHDG